jgi:D-3-phosphoglycerate dehydrogenase
MKVLVADKFEDSGLEGLRGLGLEVIYEPNLKDDDLAQRIQDSQARVLVVRSTKVTAPMFENCALGLIVRAGAGYNTIDVAAASDHGILVSNCPGKNSIAVAELAWGLIIACDRRIPANVIELREGKWNKKEYSKARGLYGRTLGLVGMGAIGQEMITRAKAFGMNVVAFSRWMSPEVAAALGIGPAGSLEELARMSDVVSVHVALNSQTRGMLGKEFFSRMKDGAIFVNTSRGEVVDQPALLEAVHSKGIIAGLDVMEEEPTGAEGAYEGTLRGENHVFVTHHIGASTEQAQEAVAAETVRIIKEFKLTGSAPNSVNVGKKEVATHLLVVRHLDRVGVLAHVLDVLRDEGVSVQEMENVILGGAKAAIAQISLDKPVSGEGLFRIKTHDAIFDATLNPL